ncbi:MAG: hypothetical protein IPG63_17880 [Xanthomonadales bacterium]|nr:hypothetical protein [Xanthomonadales bacterium]
MLKHRMRMQPRLPVELQHALVHELACHRACIARVKLGQTAFELGEAEARLCLEQRDDALLEETVACGTSAAAWMGSRRRRLVLTVLACRNCDCGTNSSDKCARCAAPTSASRRRLRARSSAVVPSGESVISENCSTPLIERVQNDRSMSLPSTDSMRGRST